MQNPDTRQRIDRSTLLLAAILAGLAMIGPFAIDTYMPSFPAIERAFGASVLEMQQTLSAYMIPYALTMLFHGALADTFGRRPVILVGVVVFALASVGCALSQSMPQMLVFRVLQGMSAGTGIVAGRAMIRDLYGGAQAQRVMSTVTMLFGIAPAIAPVIGGWLEIWFGWRSVFFFLALLGIMLFMSCYYQLKESLPASARQSFSLANLTANYLRLLGSVRFGLLSSANAFNFAGFFLYVASAPAVVYNLLGLGPTEFAWMFVPGILGIVIGAFVSGRLAGKVAPRAMVRVAYVVMFAAAAYNLVYHALFPPALPWTVLAIMMYTIGMALATPAMTLFMLDMFPLNRGLAASLQSAQQSFFSGLAAGFMSPFLSATALGLASGMVTMLICGAACWTAYAWLTKREDLQ